MDDRQVHLELVELTDPGRTFKWGAEKMPWKPVSHTREVMALTCLAIRNGEVCPITLRPKRR